MDPPIFVFVADDLSVFDSATAAEAQLDPRLASDESQRAFDSRGRRLRLRVVDSEVRLRGWRMADRLVVVEDDERTPTGQEELRSRLVDHLSGFGLDASYLAGAALADLTRLTMDGRV